MNKFRITIASPPDRDDLIAEIFCDGSQWVEINQEKGDLVVLFYSHPEKEDWEFNLDEVLEVLGRAKQKLLAMGPKEDYLSFMSPWILTFRS